MRRFLSVFQCLVAWLSISQMVSAIRFIESKSLNPCMENSNFSASLFQVTFTPDNNSLAFNIDGNSAISGDVTADLLVIAYGYTAVRETLDPCKLNLQGLCPMSMGNININSNIPIPGDVVSKIPGKLIEA